MLTKWDKRFIDLARTVAQWSKDPERKVGCVLVYPGMHKFSLGYNGLPRDIKDSADRLNDSTIKNHMTVHAELNAILNARADLTDCRAYITAAPCLECCKALIQAGISFVTCPKPSRDSTWYKSQQFGLNLLYESGIKIVHFGDISEPEYKDQGQENNSMDKPTGLVKAIETCSHPSNALYYVGFTNTMWCHNCNQNTGFRF